MNTDNKLFYGDNLTIMRDMMKLKSVDLIYLDPPFNSKKDYNLLYTKMLDKPVSEQAEAFNDTWEMDEQKYEVARAMPQLMRERGIPDEYAEFWRLWISALMRTRKPLLAYLTYMVQRLIYMKGILKNDGSIYLHCDPNASHYIKIMMDGIFGHNNFRNEIVWKRTGAHGRAKKWGPIHDTILFYSMSNTYTWNREFEKYDDSYVESFYKENDEHGRYQLVTLDGPGRRTGSSGTPWRGIDPTLKGRHWELPPDRALPEWFQHPDGYSSMSVQERLDVLESAGLIYWPSRGSVPRYKRYLEVAEGNPLQDVITDIGPISSRSSDRLGYPTQKPVALLSRIIKASTNKDGVVFDPFCGCGTTIYAAHETGRKWIGCDIAVLSVNLVQRELSRRYHLMENYHYCVDGIPGSVDAGVKLWKRDRMQFQHWFVEKVEGFPTHRKTADQGVDGRIYFETTTGLREMILSVKGGTIRPADIRELRGTMEREPNADMAGFLSIQEPTKAMRNDAAMAGEYEYFGTRYPRIQLLTLRDVFEDKKAFLTPSKLGARGKTTQGQFPI